MRRPRITATLTAARDRIEPYAAWTVRTVARNAAGHPTVPDSSQAVAWCGWGALAAERHRQGLTTDEYRAAADLLGRLAMKRHGLGLSVINDRGGPEAHASVLCLYDDAIALSRKFVEAPA